MLCYSYSVVVTGDLNYSDPSTLVEQETLLQTLESSDYINQHLTKSWLRHLQSVSSAKQFLLNQTQMFHSEDEFVRSVSNFYANQSTPYTLDVRFNTNRTRILASRYIIQGQNIHSTMQEEKMVVEIREICERFNKEGGMNVIVYNSYFPYTDQYLSIFSQTLQTILTTGLIVMAVSLVLLPDILSALTTVLSIVSTLVGTLGFMSIWGIVLDGITLINLVMCIGFSVDFSAHFSYHYIDLKLKEGTSDVVDKTLVSVMKPILQGGLSTILGLVGLIFAPSTGFVIFFKMIFIVITLGIFHSLVVLPCLLHFLLEVRSTLKTTQPQPPTLISVTKITYDNQAYIEHL